MCTDSSHYSKFKIQFKTRVVKQTSKICCCVLASAHSQTPTELLACLLIPSGGMAKKNGEGAQEDS